MPRFTFLFCLTLRLGFFLWRFDDTRIDQKLPRFFGSVQSCSYPFKGFNLLLNSFLSHRDAFCVDTVRLTQIYDNLKPFRSKIIGENNLKNINIVPFQHENAVPNLDTTIHRHNLAVAALKDRFTANTDQQNIPKQFLSETGALYRRQACRQIGL